MTGVAGPGRVRAALRVGAAAVGCAGLVLVHTGSTGDSAGTADDLSRGSLRSPAAPTPTEPGGRKPQPAPSEGGIPDLIAGLVLPESRPVQVAIPRLGIRSSLESLGVDTAGAMEVPRDPARAGWYTPGPSPGALGPAVIAGHVTWNRLPAVFSGLANLEPGDTVVVRRADGQDAVFRVQRVARFAKAEFPTRAVFGVIDHAGLRLITCGGTYDVAARRYLDNIVVFATLVGVR